MRDPVVSPEDSKILEPRQRILDLWRDGFQIKQIAEELSVSRHTVWRDMRWVHRKFIENAIDAYQERLLKQLQQIAYVENEATVEWERSKEMAVTVQETTEAVEIDGEQLADAEKTKTTTTTKWQCGDPRYLATILDCIEKRSKLLFLYAPENYARLHSPSKEEAESTGGSSDYLNDPGYIAYIREQALLEDQQRERLSAMQATTAQNRV